MGDAVPPRYAVLFKCHAWQDFERRQLRRLQQRVRSGDIFVVADSATLQGSAIDHPPERTMSIGLLDVRAIGLEHRHDAPVFWYSNDYPLHVFTRRHPDYPYYVMIEYDVSVAVDLDVIIARLHADAIDLVGEPIRTPLAQWPWRGSCEGWYDPADIRHWLSCLAIFSNRAAHRLYDRRAETSGQLRRGDVASLPMCEAVIPTELHLAGFRLLPLHALGSTAQYDTFPPYPEERLDTYREEAFVHPVLDRPRFLAKLLRAVPNPEAVLDEPRYRSLLTDGLLTEALPRLHHMLWAGRNDAGCQRIIQTMQAIRDPAYQRLHRLDGTNLARGKPAWQSSRSQWSLRPDEASGPVSGPVSGNYTFHTEQEERPWWMVDLLRTQPVGMVRVFNRMELPFRANGIEVHVSLDGRQWDMAGHHTSDRPFGGTDGNPLEIAINRPVRFVRTELPGIGILHLDQVQVLQPG